MATLNIRYSRIANITLFEPSDKRWITRSSLRIDLGTQ